MSAALAVAALVSCDQGGSEGAPVQAAGDSTPTAAA